MTKKVTNRGDFVGEFALRLLKNPNAKISGLTADNYQFPADTVRTDPLALVDSVSLDSSSSWLAS
jgi:hypothetical protein